MLISEMFFFSKILLIARKVTHSYLGQQHAIIVFIYYVVHKVTYSHFKATKARIYTKLLLYYVHSPRRSYPVIIRLTITHISAIVFI